ncbi:MAG: hypothetical protein AB7O37_13220 [Vicinamibacteria bacterium]
MRALVAAMLLASLGAGCRNAASQARSPGRLTYVAAGGDLQAALDAAAPGDVIVLAAGAVFRGPFTLPAKAGDDWVTLRSDGRLPPAGTRVGPQDASAMAALEAASGSVIVAAPGAHHYRLSGLEIRPVAGSFLANLVELGSSDGTAEEIPHHLVVERCYIHGDARRGSRRGIALNSGESSIVDSYLADFKEVGADSQAIAGWNGPGPFLIENNSLEAAGENVMFGGADPSIAGLVPADITLRRNRLAKPLAWKRGEPGYAATRWSVKNLLELKNARRVVIEGNLLEHNWVEAQAGFAVLFTVRNQDGGAPWSCVEDVRFEGNRVRHTASGINVLGFDDNHPSGQARRITIRNNLFEDVGGPRWGGGGRLLQLLDATSEVVFEHNTAFHTGNLVTADGRPHAGFVFRDNIAAHNEYGVVGSGSAPGADALRRFFPGALFRRNVIVGAPAGFSSDDNFVAASFEQVGFVDLRGGDYRLRETSPYKRAASDGRDVGVDFDALGSVPDARQR